MMKLRAILAASVTALIAVPAMATSMIPVNLAHIVDLADKAFVCTVDSAEVVETSWGWGEQITVTVSRAVKGDVAASDTVTWTQFRHTERVRMPSMPEFTVGEEYLVFLAGQVEGSPYTAPVGLDQGCFTVSHDESGNLTASNAYNNENLYTGLNQSAIEAQAGSADTQLDAIIGAAEVLGSVEDPQAAYGMAGDVELTATIQSR